MTDHYQTLGVPRNATPEEIKSAYRKLAMKHHPDRGGNPEHFQSIQAAYATLGDDIKRQQYDQPQPQGFHFEFGGGGFDFNNIFNMFGAQFGHGHPFQQHHQQQRQQHTRLSLWVTLQDVAQGGKRTVSVGTHTGSIAVEIEIPHGINDGDHVQYAKIGPNGTDLIINFRIHPNPKFQRNGLHLTTDHTVSVWDCLVGGETVVQDILGNNISMTIPAGTQPNSLLRLKGRGLPARQGQSGDLLVRIQARVPQQIDPDLVSRIKEIQKK